MGKDVNTKHLGKLLFRDFASRLMRSFDFFCEKWVFFSFQSPNEPSKISLINNPRNRRDKLGAFLKMVDKPGLVFILVYIYIYIYGTIDAV